MADDSSQGLYITKYNFPLLAENWYKLIDQVLDDMNSFFLIYEIPSSLVTNTHYYYIHEHQSALGLGMRLHYLVFAHAVSPALSGYPIPDILCDHLM